MLYIPVSMHTELIDDVQRLILYDVEIAVIALAECLETGFFVPFGMFHAYILGRYHFAVKEYIFRSIFLIVFFNYSQNLLHKSFIFRIIVDFNSHELSGFHQPVYTDCQILASHIDVSGIEQRQHSFALQML